MDREIMMRKFLTWLTDRLPARVISDDLSRPYMLRFYLFTLWGKRYYLHQFVGSDPDRGLHNHPWERAWSFILAGWYYEQRRGFNGATRTVIVKWMNTLVADSSHRVVLPPGMPSVWTLFVHTVGDVQPWGFYQNVVSQDVSVSADGEEVMTIRRQRSGEPTDGTALFREFRYPGGTKKAEWWKDAQDGATVRSVINLVTTYTGKSK